MGLATILGYSGRVILIFANHEHKRVKRSTICHCKPQTDGLFQNERIRSGKVHLIENQVTSVLV